MSDSKSERIDRSHVSLSPVRQCWMLFVILMKLKLLRMLFLPILVGLLINFIYVSLLLTSMTSTKETSETITFYGTSEFVSSNRRVLVDRTASTAEVEAAESIVTERAGKTANWLVDCTPEKECSSKFMNEHDKSVIAYMRYQKSGSSRLSMVECLMEKDSDIACAFLYQLMLQSMSKVKSPNSVFKDVRFFTLIDESDSSKVGNKSTNSKPLSLPKSVCSDWINTDEYIETMGVAVTVSLLLISIGMSLYHLITTVSCIRIIKTDGFLQQLFRNGLSVTSYWTVIWFMAILECLLFSLIFVLSHTLHCPGIYPSDKMINVFLMFNFYCLSFAALAILFELLIPSLLAIFMLFMGITMAITILSQMHSNIEKSASFLLTLFPQLHAKNYISSHMTADITRRQNAEDQMSAKQAQYQKMMLCNLFAVLVLVLLIAYLDFVLRSGNGLCLPPYYPFSCRFWCPQSKGDNSETNDGGQEAEMHIEPVADPSPSIIVRNISKTYNGCCSAGPRVLNGLSCKLYRNQITALIGHNGAGKSTLIKILTGEELPDSGGAFISGIEATDPLGRLGLRGRISICPQFDSLCSALTVIESIEVTLSSKRVSLDGSDEVERARSMLHRLGLGDKENVKSTDLSGGQKRKVNTILALLGDPDVVFLDEPTSGLDPVSRRQLWQLLQEEKVGRSIVLCTQFMDEADILADRKIFLCGGQIVCAGSSMFLKRAFGCSLTLNVSLRSKADASKLMATLNEVKLKSQFETELQLEVPASKPSILVEAVQALESSQLIQAFGLSQATLDDIFMTLSGVSSTEITDAFRSGELFKFFEKSKADPKMKDSGELGQSLGSIGQSERLRPSIFRQFGALFRTNLKRQYRTVSSFWTRFVVPALLLAIIGIATVALRSMKAGEEERRAGMNESDTKVPFSGIRTRGVDIVSKSICVLDTPVLDKCEDFVANLTATDSKSLPCGLVLCKSPSESLESFLVLNSTLQRLRTFRGTGSNGASTPPCIIYHASSWDFASEPNVKRTINIGLLRDAPDSKFHQVYGLAFQMGFANLAQRFNTGYWPTTKDLSQLTPFSQYQVFFDMIELMLFLFLFGLFPVSYLSDPIEDIGSRVRDHLVSMGMTRLAYWTNTFFLHWIQYTTCFAISVLLLCIWERYRNVPFIVGCIPVLFLGTASNQMTVYAAAAIAKTPSTVLSLSCNFFAVSIPIIFIALSTKGLPVVASLILLVPPVAPIAIIYYTALYITYSMEYYFTKDINAVPYLLNNIWGHMYIRVSVLAMLIHIFVMCCAIAIAESGAAALAEICTRCCKFCNCCGDSDIRNSVKLDVNPMDKGAERESDRVLQSMRNPQNVLEVRQLCKTYANGVRAVKGVTFGTMAGEIFGLLGANGAGKTTSMSVIVGEEFPTQGVCEVRMKDGSWVSGRHGASSGAIGYCPQHNPLFDCITVAEHLKLYADIRGVPSSFAEIQASSLVKGLGLQPHKDKYTNQLSGGNKRRLCLAIALLGDPALIVVDEASTGVDPENKRFIWSAIRRMLHDQRSVMVTTHSMEEVDALCSRVGIMNKGRMIAFGTVQQLRSLHGDAYTLDVMLKPEHPETVQQKKAVLRNAVAAEFKGAVVLEELNICIQFYVPQKSVGKLSAALKWLSANEGRLGIDYYSMYQMSLDQVFVKLVKQYDKTK